MKDNNPKIKQSNLLINDEKRGGNTIQMNAALLLETRVGVMNRFRRRSLPLCRTSQGRKQVSPAKSDKEIPQIIDKPKINRIDFEANFMGQDHQSKRQTHDYFDWKGSDQRGKAISITKKTQMSVGVAKNAKKRPIFGLEQMGIYIKSRLKNKIKNAIYLNVSTNNTPFSRSFYSTGKKKTNNYMNRVQERTSPGAEKFIYNKIEPNVVTLLPQKLHRNQMIERRKNINTMYSYTAGGWNRQRSRTEETEGNPVCGWEGAKCSVIDEGLNGQHSFF